MDPTITLFQVSAGGKFHAAEPDIDTANPTRTGRMRWFSTCSALRRWQDPPLPVDVPAARALGNRSCATCGPRRNDLACLLETPLGTTPVRWYAVSYTGRVPWPVQLLAARMPGSATADTMALLAAPRGAKALLQAAPRARWRRSPHWELRALPTALPMPADPGERALLAATVVTLTTDGGMPLAAAFEAASRL